MKEFDLTHIQALGFTAKDIGRILQTYFFDHSSRRYMYLYWFVHNTTAPNLCFCNQNSDKIERSNDPQLCFRIVRVTDRKCWKLINLIISIIILKDADKRSINVIRLGPLMQYLKSIKMDLEQIEYAITEFGTRTAIVKKTIKAVAYSMSSSGEKVTIPEKDRLPDIITENTVILSHIVGTIHCQFLLDRLYINYMPYVTANDIESENIADIINADKLEYTMLDGNLTISLTDGLDIISLRYVNKLIKGGINWKLEQLKYGDEVFNIVNRFTSPSMIVLSIRAYMHYFVDAAKRKIDKRKLTKHKKVKK